MTTDNGRESMSDVFSLRAFLEAFLRHKKKAVFYAASVIGIAAAILLIGPRKYRSEARLFLQVGRESVRLDPTATTGNTIALQQSGRDTEIATAMEVLRSRAIIDKTVDKLTPAVVLSQAGAGATKPNPMVEAALAPLRYVIGLVKSIDPISEHEEAAILIQRNFWVDAEHDSTLIMLGYDAKSAPLAQQVLDTVVDVFRDDYTRLHHTHGSKPFFVEQRAELEKTLKLAEVAFRDAKSRMGVASIDARRDTLEHRLASIELSRNLVIQSLASDDASIASLKEQTRTMPAVLHTSTTVLPNTGADELRSQLYALQVRLMNYEAKYNGDHPLVQAARKQVDEAKQMVGEETESREETVESINENHRKLMLNLAEAESHRAGLEARKAELNQQRTAVQKDLLQLNGHEVELQDLDRARQLASSNFFASAQKFEQARIDEELDNQRITNVNIAQEATLIEKPVSPSKLIIAGLAGLLLSAGTVGLVLGCQKLDSRLSSEDQVEYLLGLPVLGCVPEGRAYGSIPKAMK